MGVGFRTYHYKINFGSLDILRERRGIINETRWGTESSDDPTISLKRQLVKIKIK